MDDEFGPIRKSLKKVSVGSITQSNYDTDDLCTTEIIPLQKRARHAPNVLDTPFAIVNYPCIVTDDNRKDTYATELFYEQLLFKTFRYKLLDNLLQNQLEFAPALNQIAKSLYKLVIKSFNKELTTVKNYRIVAPEVSSSRFTSNIIDNVVVFDTVASKHFNLINIRLESPEGFQAKDVSRIHRFLKKSYPIDEVPMQSEGLNGLKNIIDYFTKLNSTAIMRSIKPLHFKIDIFQYNYDVEKITNIIPNKPNFKIIISTIGSSHSLYDNPITTIVNLSELSDINLSRMCQQALHCKCDMGKHTGLKEYQDLWNHCVADITQNKLGSNNLFHLFLVSFTIGGLGTNFFFYLEQKLNGVRSMDQLLRNFGINR